jgi:trk system potassium uptake protein TrkH
MRLINPLAILRILSNILIIEAVSILVCLPVALNYKETTIPFIWSSGIAAFISAVFYIISRNADTSKFSNRDGYLAVTLAWIIFSAIGALPYLFSGSINSFIDAFFESTSGFSTTGSSIFEDVEVLPYSILFWRSFTHWIGGLGIIVLVVMVLPSLKVTGYQLFSLESSLKEKIHPRTKAVVFRIMLIYVTLTILEVAFLMAGDMNFFDSICHSFGTIATGGFSTKNTSLMSYSKYSQYVVMVFMFLAGISQIVYYFIVKLNFRKVKNNEELWFYIAAIVVAGSLASYILLANTVKTPEEAFREGYFQTISIMTCTGFASTDFIYWPNAGLVLLFFLMFSGGSTGSTSGGIKMARHLIVIKNIKNVFVRLSHPNIVTSIKLNGKAIGESTNIAILSFIILYFFLFIIGSLIITASGVDPESSATAVATCMAGIGPGMGSVGPMSNFSGLPEIDKFVLSLLMIIGRLEIITVLVLFSKSFWKL